MNNLAENTAVKQKNESKLRFFVRLIGRDGQSSVSEFSEKDKAMKYAKDNDKPEEGVYPHAYDREQTDEQGNYKKIYPIAEKTTQ